MLTGKLSLGSCHFFAALLLSTGCGSTTSTWNTKGLQIKTYRPLLAKTQGGSRSANGKTAYYEIWDGIDGRHRIDYSVEGMRLVVNKRDFGPVSKNDKIELYEFNVIVNGQKRDPVSTP